jgi:sulfite exporter TauE/SafE
MCGGISAALGMGTGGPRRHWLLLLFQLGRIATYALLGAGLGAILAAAAELHLVILPALRILSGLLLAAMGLYVANWWMGLTRLEQAGQAIWKRVEPLARRRLPVSSARDALAVGLLWGFLPCGLIYSALAWAAAGGSWQQSALLMAAFGLGTLPSMLATGLAAQRLTALLRQRGLRVVAGALLVLAGLWTSWIGVQHAGHSAHRAAAGQHAHH